MRTTAQCFLALFAAFIGATISGLLVAIIAAGMGVFGNLLQNSPSAPELICIPLVGALYLVGVFGIWIPVYAIFQFVIIGLPVAGLAWRFQVSSLRKIAVLGFVSAGFPWIPIAGVLVLIQGSTPIPEKLAQFGWVVLVGLLMGLCGVVAGACFWKTMQSFRVEPVQDPVVSNLSGKEQGA